MMSGMRAMRGRRGRWIGVGAAAAAALAVAVVVGWSAPAVGPGPSGSAASASDGPPAIGPIVYYEVLDADGSHLMERRLDGRSLARVVATREEVDFGRTWTVDPAGTVAIAAVPDARGDDQTLEAVPIAGGAALWSIRTPIAPVDAAVWSADGGRLAQTTVGPEDESREAIVVDTATGRFVRAAIPEDALVQGFAGDGSLILRQRLPSPQGVEVAWRFLRLDLGTRIVNRLAAVPDVGPASDWSEDVDPSAGVGVDTTIGVNDQGTAIRLWRLAGGASRVLATLPSVDRIAIDPGGTGVAISAAQTIRFVAFDGGASDLFSGPDPIADFGWSTDGDYLAVSTDRRGPNLTIVERATGRSLELPHPDAVAQLLLVRIVGGVPLPAEPLPAAEPTPSPTAAPSGSDIPAFAGLLSGWVDPAGERRVVHVERLVPTEAGGMRIAAAMPPLDLGPPPVPDDGGPELRLLPRPGSDDVLVWIGAEEAAGWLWDGASGLERIALPADWPDNAYDVRWRPDGLAIAASAGRVSAANEFEGIFVIAELGGATTTVVPIVGDYDRLEGWWSATELRVGHGICTEGCEGRYAYSARLRVADHRLLEMTPADRADGPVDEAIVDADRGTVVLSLINDDPADDVVVAWPAGLGPIEALEVIGVRADGSLLVALGTAGGTDLYRVADPAGRAVAGRLDDPRPERLGHLERRDVQIDVSPDGGWATVTDRVENVRLVRLADGRSWPVDRERTLVWAGAPG
jgi:hypothetical protein